jgi:Ca-activated chloride channel family protein
MEIDDALPRRIPDLFAGRTVLVAGMYRGPLPSVLKVTGHVGQRSIVLEIPVDSAERHISRPGIPAVWARKRISELIRRAAIDPSSDVLALGRQLSVEHRIASPFASFIIVDTKSGN